MTSWQLQADPGFLKRDLTDNCGYVLWSDLQACKIWDALRNPVHQTSTPNLVWIHCPGENTGRNIRNIFKYVLASPRTLLCILMLSGPFLSDERFRRSGVHVKWVYSYPGSKLETLEKFYHPSEVGTAQKESMLKMWCFENPQNYICSVWIRLWVEHTVYQARI